MSKEQRSEPRLVEVRQHILKNNDVLARSLRARFEQAGMLVVSMLRVPGSQTNLLDAIDRGAEVRMVYSPLDALKIAGRSV